MAQAETKIVHDIQCAVSKTGARMFKNVRGGAYPIAVIKPLIAAILKRDWQMVIGMVKNLRPLKYGMQPDGSSDLIGWVPVVVTPDMVGRTMAVFCAVEVKTADGRPSPEQLNFIDIVLKSGGFAGVARSAEDGLKIMQKGA